MNASPWGYVRTFDSASAKYHARYQDAGGMHDYFIDAYADGTLPARTWDNGAEGDEITVLLADDGTPISATPKQIDNKHHRCIDRTDFTTPGGTMTATITLDAQILSNGPTPDKQLLALTLPGKDAPTVRRFATEHLAAGLDPQAGDTVRVTYTPGPGERITIAAITAEGHVAAPAAPAEPPPPPAPKREIPRVEGPPASELPRGIYYPQPDPGYRMPPELEEYAETLALLHRDGQRVNGIVMGPPGGGKTSFIAEFAAKWGHPYCKIDFGTITDPEYLLGHRTFADGATRYTEGLLVRALRTPNCVIHADEINRTLTQNTNVLLPVLDHTGRVWSEYLQEYLTVDPSVIFLGTANMEAADAGTFRMNPALKSRLEYPVVVGFPAPAEEAAILVRRCRIDEKVAAALVDFAGEIRRLADPSNADPLEESLGTRNLIAVGHLVRNGLSAGDAIKHCILPRYSTEGGDGSQQAQVAKILQGRFGR